MVGTRTVCLLGNSGAGKGTLAERLDKSPHMITLNMGGALRELTQTDKVLDQLFTEGKMAPEETVTEIVRTFIGKHATKGGILLLDGFPRRVDQLEALTRQLVELGMPAPLGVYLRVPESVVTARLKARGRSDDTETAIGQRLRNFNEYVIPTINELRALGMLVEVNGDQKPDLVLRDVLKRLQGKGIDLTLQKTAF